MICLYCHAGQRRYAYTVTQDSDDMPILSRRTAKICLYCHAGQQQLQVAGIAQKAARNRRRQGAAKIRSGGPISLKYSPDGATWHASGNQACYSFIDPGGMKGRVGLVG